MTVKDTGALLVAIAPALMSVPVVGPAVGAVLSSEPAIVAFSGLMAVNAGASGYNAYQAARADDWQTFTSEAGNVVLSSVFAGSGFRSLRAPRLTGLYTGEYTTSRYGDIRIKVPVRTPNPALASKPYGGLTIRAAEKAAGAGRRDAADDVAFNNGWRTSDGKFARPRGPGQAGATAENAVWDAVEAKPGWKVTRGRVYVTDSTGQIRVYDGIAEAPSGRIIGLEVKSGTARLTPAQRTFDTRLNSLRTNVAEGMGKHSNLNIRRAVTIRVP